MERVGFELSNYFHCQNSHGFSLRATPVSFVINERYGIYKTITMEIIIEVKLFMRVVIYFKCIFGEINNLLYFQ